MPVLFACPTDDPHQLIPRIEGHTPRLDGIMSALRGECLEVVSTIYREVPTRDVPVITDLLHEFQKGDREELSDLRLDFPEIPEECYEASPEVNNLGGSGESPEIFDMRIQSALRLSQKLGRNVLLVAPVQVIKHVTGITIQPGEILRWTPTSS